MARKSSATGRLLLVGLAALLLVQLAGVAFVAPPRAAQLHAGQAAALAGAAALHQQRAPPRAEEKAEEPVAYDDMGFVHTVVGGVVQPYFMRTACLEDLRQNFTLRGSDIVVSTYPRCGTTWMQKILLLLLSEGDESQAKDFRVQSPWIECVTCLHRLGITDFAGKAMSVQELMAWDGKIDDASPAVPRRVFKTHAPVQLLPWRGGLAGCGGAKVVVVVRNPKDTCVSRFHHARDLAAFQYRGDFRHFVTELFLPGRVGSGCFWAWHAGWEKAAAEHPETVVLVSYEELVRDFEGTVRRVSQFLEIPVSDSCLADVKDKVALSVMKKQQTDMNKELEARGLPSKKDHVRAGKVGSWRDVIDGALLQEFDAVHRSKTALHRLRYEFDYGDD
mmetsp:Transcript_1392/g.3801  ORF Transcript_1392/g.3801 Transcript_1392/m.3801 type:complete len:390 (-) Transcript_1392:67-1236(-)